MTLRGPGSRSFAVVLLDISAESVPESCLTLPTLEGFLSVFTHASPRRGLVAAATLGLLATSLSLAVSSPASANPAGTGLVISEVYGGGGNGGATYTHDFVELYNPTASAISLQGLSVQYRSSGGTVPNGVSPVALSGSLDAGKHFLVQMASTAAVGAPLPTPDASGSYAMSGSSGQAFLVNGTGVFTATGNVAGNPGLVDMVGYGTGNNTFEGATEGTALTASTAAQRATSGADTDNNPADFSVATPSPTPSGGVTPPPPPPAPVAKTIAEIQGTTNASPLVTENVVTTGVVTAAYPTGGLNGFFLQTGGAGGATDATPNASDGIFVQAASASVPALGASVRVTGIVSESFGRTQIASSSIESITALAPVTPLSLPWTELDTDTEKEAHEGERLAPQGPFTVTNSFTINTFGEIGLASGTTPLIQPTEVRDFQTGNPQEITAANDLRKVVLDDGSSSNYLTTNRNVNLPWLSPTTPVRVGAPVTFTGPVILDFGFGLWRFQPTSPITDTGAGTATFANTRTAAPESVGGDIRLATFNVLNYFPTTGEAFEASGNGTCTYFTDREANRIANNSCTNNGPRGAANTVSFERQQAKIVDAINKLGASVVSLEELENSVQFFTDNSKTTRLNRDSGISKLVEALNTASAPGTWAFAPSPDAADLPTPAQEDVIRTGFIYKPADVQLVGASVVLKDETNFDNAREPLAQAFKAVGAPDNEAFGVIVNHFKSKGGAPSSGDNADTGQGGFNFDRIGQATALKAFAADFKTLRGIEALFLAGDFNSYSQEDPLQVLTDGGAYTPIESDTEGEETYSFGGLSGSLDHVLANDAALSLVTGADVWNINSAESTAYQYSRYNYNLNSIALYNADPFSSSDHDPEIVGLDLAEVVVEPATRDIQILATNDFHGRLQNNATGAEAGAAVLAGAIKQLRSQNPDTVFAAAGDLIGASTFESFIQNDKPTIDALNEAGLEVSAVGNHELDQGYDDLVNRVLAPESAGNPEGGAAWEYIAANLKLRATGDDAVPATFIKQFGAVEVGFVGAVTEDLPSLVSPDGIAQLEVTDIVDSVNEEASLLEDEGADVIVLLVHEGAATTSIASATDNSAFGQIVNGVNADVDAIVSGHTHLAYNHAVVVPEWVTEARPVTTRPVVSAGQYGAALNKLVFTVDTATGAVTAKTQDVVNLKTGQTANFPSDATTASIVSDAVAEAEVLGAVPLGDIGGAFSRAKLVDGTTENRGGESTLGNLVAEIQQWATETPEAGAAQIAFMNPGGLRADLTGTGTGPFPRQVTFKQAAVVQPFANTLVNMRLTGAQIETVLEQQWQPAGVSRPFLKLGTSEGFTYTYLPPAAGSPAGTKGEVTAMYLDGQLVDDATVYSVTVNSFLASGGDNFGGFNAGTGKRDTGKSDLQAQVDYFAEFADDAPLPVDYSQRSVGVKFPAGAPASYSSGGTVAFDLSSLAMSAPVDQEDANVVVSLDGSAIGTFPVNNTIGTAVNDEYGTASVVVSLPAGTTGGAKTLTVRGPTTGTVVEVPITVDAPVPPTPTTVSGTAASMTYGTNGSVQVTVTPAAATGLVSLSNGAAEIGQARLSNGTATIAVPGDALEPGTYSLTLRYAGDATHAASTSQVALTVAKGTSSTTASAAPSEIEIGETAEVAVNVAAAGTPASGVVEAVVDGEVVDSATLSGGSATLTVGPFTTAGAKAIVVRYLGSARVAPSEASTTVTVTEAELVESTTTADARPDTVVVNRGRSTVRVEVTAPGTTPTGIVTATVDGRAVDIASLDDAGRATLQVGPFDSAGRTRIQVRYNGSDTVKPSASSTFVQVEKAAANVKVAVDPGKIVVDRTRARVEVRVVSQGEPVNGIVQVRVAGEEFTRRLGNDGTVTLLLPKFDRVGRYALVVSLEGNDQVAAETDRSFIRVVRR